MVIAFASKLAGRHVPLYMYVQSGLMKYCYPCMLMTMGRPFKLLTQTWLTFIVTPGIGLSAELLNKIKDCHYVINEGI